VTSVIASGHSVQALEKHVHYLHWALIWDGAWY